MLPPAWVREATEMLMVAEKRFRRLNAPELLADLYAGAG